MTRAERTINRVGTLAVACAALGWAAAPAVAQAAGQVKRPPVIKDEEAGYFGSAVVAHRIWVFVYSNLGPRAGTHVTVCLKHKCVRARGHGFPSPWYAASFRTSGLRMGDPVSFSIVASNSAGRSRVSVTKPLLCMHNDGSTPQH